MATMLLKKFLSNERDARGAYIATYSNPIEFDGALQPVVSSESDAAGYSQRVTDHFRLLNYSEPISHKDIVIIDGDEYQVVGKEFDWSEWNPFSDFGSRTVEIVRVTG